MKTQNKISIWSIIISILIATPLSSIISYKLALKEFNKQRQTLKTESIIRLKRDLIYQVEGYIVLIQQIGIKDYNIDIRRDGITFEDPDIFWKTVYDKFDYSSIYEIVNTLNNNNFDVLLQQFYPEIYKKYANLAGINNLKVFSDGELASYFYTTFFTNRLYYDLLELKDDDIKEIVNKL